jgi:hypothetical protein
MPAPASSLAEILPAWLGVAGWPCPAPGPPPGLHWQLTDRRRPGGGTCRRGKDAAGAGTSWPGRVQVYVGRGPGPCQWRLPLTGAAAAQPCELGRPSPPAVMAFLAAQIAIAFTISCILLSECATRLLAASSALKFRPSDLMSFFPRRHDHFSLDVMTKVIITCPSLPATKTDYERYSSPVAFCPAAFRSFF